MGSELADGARALERVTAEAVLAKSKVAGAPAVDGSVAAPVLTARPARQKASEAPTAGRKWFDLPRTELTPEVKRELEILRSRNVLDPKRFYKTKKDEKKRFPTYFAIGTVQENPYEYTYNRLKNKERSATFSDGLFADSSFRSYAKRKYEEVAARNQRSGAGAYRKKFQARRGEKANPGPKKFGQQAKKKARR